LMDAEPIPPPPQPLVLKKAWFKSMVKKLLNIIMLS